MKLLYVDLFCGAGGTSTGVENARHNGEQCARVLCEALCAKLIELNIKPLRIAA